MTQRGIAIAAVLALLAGVSLLMLASFTLATVNWLSARNLRQGLYAWSRAEAAVSISVSELEDAYRRDSTLPDTYALDVAEDLETAVTYAKTADGRAELVVVARFGSAAVRRTLRLDMTE
jgi:Tfp pilus assembly protein PilX